MSIEEDWQVKDFKVILKDFEDVIKTTDKYGRSWLLDGNNLDKKTDGIPIEGGDIFKMRYREAWGNWLLCAMLRFKHDNDDITFRQDSTGQCDGYILNGAIGKLLKIEHVSALDNPKVHSSLNIEERIMEAINKKIEKGLEYAKGKNLIVLFDGVGIRYPNKIRKKIITIEHGFAAVFIIGLFSKHEDGYAYSIISIDDERFIVYEVCINSTFTDWNVSMLYKEGE